jgi:hypothetical protein
VCWVGDSLFDHNLVSVEFQPTKAPNGQATNNIMPPGNTYIPTLSTIFVAYAPEGGDYHLITYKNSGSDGEDPGADVDAVNQHIAGVR